jgi:uncharacterized protein with HEPN domain
MVDRIASRLRDIKNSIGEIRSLLAGKSFEEVSADSVARAAFERFLEILSEASRHLPEPSKMESAAGIPWREIAALGNRLRHEYRLIELRTLWSIYENDLAPLEHAVDAMLAARDR